MAVNNNFKNDFIIQRLQNGEIDVKEALRKYINKKENSNIIKKSFHTNTYINGNKKQNSKLIKEPEKKEIDQEEEIKIIKEKRINDLFKKMDKLIGLESVKRIIHEYIAYIQVQEIREKYGLKSSPIVMHMIFKGNPGTGKTTIARILGGIFKEMGFLKNNEIIETERADLVGEYIGHTAQKTKKLIQKALGGILFVDEAYSLARGGEKDFGKEAIDTMVKAMEDNKDNLIIILAGYHQEMDSFLRTNPGLASRFALQINFPDYTIDQLVEIAKIMYQEREYILDNNSKHYIYNVISRLKYKEIINGNARTIRNLVELSIRRQAKRIIKNNSFTKEQLIYIKKEDLLMEE